MTDPSLPSFTDPPAGDGAGRGDSEVLVLVARARAGDRQALDALVRATYADTFTLAYRLTGNDDDARDVAQEAYLRAWRALDRFRGEAQFGSWMYRITANCASTLLAKRARQRSRTEPLTDEVAPPESRREHDPEDRARAADERRRLTAALAEMPLRLRQVIVLRDIYDLPHASIAQELGITEAAAKVRLHRARRRLRDHLERPDVPSNRPSWPDTQVI